MVLEVVDVAGGSVGISAGDGNVHVGSFRSEYERAVAEGQVGACAVAVVKIAWFEGARLARTQAIRSSSAESARSAFGEAVSGEERDG
ncbi:hypothetical protein E4U54_002389 [Claviceps lovelessii]|nr:hypothetical protein E4U54_002389 [Claviceps lovelessii]